MVFGVSSRGKKLSSSSKFPLKNEQKQEKKKSLRKEQKERGNGERKEQKEKKKEKKAEINLKRNVRCFLVFHPKVKN